MCPQLFDIIQAVLLDITHSGVAADLPLPTIGSGNVFGGISGYNPLPRNGQQAAIISLLKALPKKFTDAVPGESLTDAERNDAAMAKFLEANARCEAVNARLRVYLASGFNGETPLDSFIRGALGEAQRFLHDMLSYTGSDGLITDSVPIRDLFASLRCGPGASNGAVGDTFVDKCLRGPLTTTSEGLYALYQQAIKTSPLLHRRESTSTFSSFDDGSERSGTWNPAWSSAERLRDDMFGHPVLSGSKLSFAPKSWKISRTIATEPSLNMMFQLGLHEQLCFFLSRVGLSLPTQQERNRALAKRGSETGDWFTMDLSSASDSVSIELVKYLFPRDWYEWFMLTRSPTVTLPNGDVVELHMLSSMGNGYTFAVETCVFLSLLVGVYQQLGLPVTMPSRDRTGNLAVYGDDIIGITEAFGPLSLVLEHCGFLVNHDKSFCSGPFRESCGGDYFLGMDIRGVYSTTVSTPQDRVSLINRLVDWGTQFGIAFPLTSELMLKGDPLVVVPLWEADDAGLRVPFTLARDLGVTRRAGRTLARILGCDPGTSVYRNYQVVPTREVLVSTKGRPTGILSLSGDMAMLAVLSGALRGRWLTLRSFKTTYELRFAVAPGWDGPRAGAVASYAQRAWSEIYRFNLIKSYSWLDARREVAG